MSKRVDVLGQRFGRLVVLRLGDPDANNHRYWVCQCDCGNVKEIGGSMLLHKMSQSCGCLRRETMEAFWKSHTTHGGRRSREYRIWREIKSRCFNENCWAYKYYGGRVITMCDRWRASFANFIADMGPRPSPRHSIDRIDNDGNYEPGNCRWATRVEQARNTIKTRFATINGERRPLREWAEISGIEFYTLYTRSRRLGWPDSELLRPVK